MARRGSAPGEVVWEPSSVDNFVQRNRQTYKAGKTSIVADTPVCSSPIQFRLLPAQMEAFPMPR
jgi:hypothetical protein